MLLCGCGRIAFDPIALGGGGGDDGGGGDSGDGISGLVAHYPMDFVGSATPDVSGNHHDAACNPPGDNCPVATPGRRAMALSFDGGDDQLSAPSAPDLQTTTGFTVAFWVRIPVAPQSRSCAVQKRLAAGNFDSWQLCVEPDASLFYFTCDDIACDFHNTVAKLPATDWHHIALLWDGADKWVTIDGVEVGRAAVVVTFDDQPLLFGLDYDGGTAVSVFRGELDDIRIYNRPLSDVELAVLRQ